MKQFVWKEVSDKQVLLKRPAIEEGESIAAAVEEVIATVRQGETVLCLLMLKILINTP